MCRIQKVKVRIHLHPTCSATLYRLWVKVSEVNAGVFAINRAHDHSHALTALPDRVGSVTQAARVPDFDECGEKSRSATRPRRAPRPHDVERRLAGRPKP